MEIRPPHRPTRISPSRPQVAEAPPDELLTYAADRLGGIVFELDADTRIVRSVGRARGEVVVRRGRTRGRLAREVYADVPEVLDALGRSLAGERVAVRIELHGTVYDCDYIPVRQAATGAVVRILGSAVVVRGASIPEVLGLPPRQAEVAERLAAGQTVGAIAHAMYLSPKTVSEYARRLRKALGLETTNELIAHGARLGWGELYRRQPSSPEGHQDSRKPSSFQIASPLPQGEGQGEGERPQATGPHISERQ